MAQPVQTAILLRFDEPQSVLAPSDETGNLEDLVADPTSSPALVTPDSETGFIGRARQGEVGQGFIGKEAVADSTRLTRDMSIEAIIGTATWRVTNGTRVIIARGKND